MVVSEWNQVLCFQNPITVMWQENRDRPFPKNYSVLLTGVRNVLVLGAVLQVTAAVLFQINVHNKVLLNVFLLSTVFCKKCF